MRKLLFLSLLLVSGCASWGQNACYETIRAGIEDEQMLSATSCPSEANGG
jgi:hypothetical protein